MSNTVSEKLVGMALQSLEKALNELLGDIKELFESNEANTAGCRTYIELLKETFQAKLKKVKDKIHKNFNTSPVKTTENLKNHKEIEFPKLFSQIALIKSLQDTLSKNQKLKEKNQELQNSIHDLTQIQSELPN